MRDIKFRAEHEGKNYNVSTRKPLRGDHKGHYKENGYVMRLVTEHPKMNKRGYVKEHRLVMEEKLGRFLEDNEIVHHHDENRSNNDYSNLKLVDNRSHYTEHSPKRNDNGQFVAYEEIFSEIKFSLFDRDKKIVQIYTLKELTSKTYRRAKFEFRGRYTGLKDKNGLNEIYEGDICRGHRDDEDVLYEITWMPRCAKFGAKVIKSEYVLSMGLSFPLQHYIKDGTLECTFVRVGNIYETAVMDS